jgi:hypothetical protein
VKTLASLILLALVLVAAPTATLAHVDSLGQPDPSWQQPAAAARDSRVPIDGTAPAEDFFSSGGLSVLLLALGALLALDLATAPGSRAARAGAPAKGLRTVEVLPASASRETRLVLRAAAAIAFTAILLGELHAGDRAPGGKPFQTVSGDTTTASSRP